MTDDNSDDSGDKRRPDAPVPVRSPDGTINRAYLQTLHKIGFKLVPLRRDGTPAVRWTEIREGWRLWDAKYLSENYHLFHNVAAAVGPAPNEPPHYPRSNGSPTERHFVFNAVLDIDGEAVYEKLKAHIERWKQETYVTKTRKPWGYHVHFCTEKPLNDLRGNGYELKARNGLVTLPYSAHRSDPGFTYAHVGIESIAFWEQAKVDELLGLLNEFGLVETGAQIDYDDDGDGSTATATIMASYEGSLGGERLHAITGALYDVIKDYYLPNYRNDVTLVYTGVLYRRGVALDDARQIVRAICSLAGDSEADGRIATLEATYSSSRGAGRPKMAEIVKAVKGWDQEEAAKAQANDIVGQMIAAVRAYVPDPHIHTRADASPQQQSLPNPNQSGNGDPAGTGGPTSSSSSGDDDSGDIPPATKTMRDYLAEFCPELMPTLDRHVYNIITIDDKWARIVIADGNTRTIRLAKIVEKSSGRGDEKQVWHEIVAGDVIAECILTNIKRIEDPLYSEVRWQFGTISHDGKYRQYGPATLETLFQHMGADNLVHKRQVSWFESFSSLLDAYQRAGKVQVIREVKSPGFFIVNDDDSPSSGKAKKKVLLACKFDHHDPVREKLVAATEALDHLYQAHYTTELARKKLAHVVKLAVVAPLSFARRQLGVANLNAGFIPGLIMSGESEAGKTYGYGGLVLAINRLDSGEYIRPVRDSGTVARFTHFLSYSTFPIVFDEADYLTESRQQPNIVELIGLLKNAIDKTNSIHLTKNHERVVTYMMGLPILTMNGYAPSEDGLLRRYTVWEFTKNDRVRDTGLIECFNDDISSRLKDALGAIGDFRTQFILEEVNGRGNLDVLAKTKWHELGSIILQRMYEAAGVPYPAWLDEYTSSDHVRTREDVRNERVDGIISCLRKMVGEAWARHRSEFSSIAEDDGGSGIAVDTYTKLYLLLRHTTSLADFRYDLEKGVIITTSFIEALRRSGVERIGNLKQLAEYTGLNYERIRVNGEQRRYVVCGIRDLADFIDGRRGGGDGSGNNSSSGDHGGSGNGCARSSLVVGNGGSSSSIASSSDDLNDASKRPVPLASERELDEAVTQKRINLVMHVYRELARDAASGGVDEEELVTELCKTGSFLPPWYSKDADHATNTHAYRMNISRQYAIACVSAAVHKGLLERTADNDNKDNNNNNKHMLRTPAKNAAAITTITTTVSSASDDSTVTTTTTAPAPQQQKETFAPIEQLVTSPIIHFAPGYRRGEEIVAYGTAGSSQQHDEYHVIGVAFKDSTGERDGTVTWLCPYCPDRFTLYFYYRSHLKDLHHGRPFIGNPGEEAFISASNEFNRKNMKRVYGDTWQCTLCSRRGDRWYITDHDCPHFIATTARPSHSPQSLPLPLQQQQLQPVAPAPAGHHHSGAIGAAAGGASGQPGPRENSRDLPGASPHSA
ncbi:MAG TPA: hypothetical protein VF172_01040 [Nitrososphaera sp.]